MSIRHKVMIAGAGAGKTTYLVKKMLSSNKYALITTFTIRNAEEIKSKIRELNKGAIPHNIDVITWDAFLLKHGIRPFIKCFTKRNVKGALWVTCQADGAPRGISASSIAYYMTSTGKVYSDKLANLACKCDDASDGMVVERLSRCYGSIFIDEAQDLSGYDFEFVKILLQQSKAEIILTCDPRQTTYSTHYEKKNQKYNDGHIDNYIADNCKNTGCEIDSNTLNQSYRCRQEICSFSSQLYSDDYPEVVSKAEYTETGHDGVFLIKLEDVEKYLNTYSDVVQLIYSRATKAFDGYPVINMGESKGTTFNRTLIYPTLDMLKWVGNRSINLKPKTKAEFYVALTRARYSVAIVCKDKKIYESEKSDVYKWHL